MPDYKKVWIICEKCGYNIEVFEDKLWNYCECAICGGLMTSDLNNGKNSQEVMGDNFPKINTAETSSVKYKYLNKKLYPNNNELDEHNYFINNTDIPKITQSDIEDFRIDLETLSIREIFKRLGE